MELPAAEAAVKEVFPRIADPTQKAKRLLKDPIVQAEIQKRLEILKYRVDYTSDDVLKALWSEATFKEKGSSHNARISALVWLGKHIHMFKDKEQKKESDNITYNLISYKTDQPQLIKEVKSLVLDNQPEIDKVEDEVVESIENLQITKYN